MNKIAQFRFDYPNCRELTDEEIIKLINLQEQNEST